MNRLRLLAVLFAAAVVALSAAAYRIWAEFSTLQARTARVDRIQKTLVTISKLETGLRDLSRLEYTHLLRIEQAVADSIGARVDELWDHTETLRDAYPDTSDAHRAIVLLRADIAQRIRLLRSTLADSAETQAATDRRVAQSRALTVRGLALLDSLQYAEARRLASYTRDRTIASETTVQTLRLGFIGFGVLTVVLFGLLVREYRRSIRYQSTLEAQLSTIRQSQAELEQISYAVNHHLQEPLRKIGVFSDRLLRTAGPELPALTSSAIQRMSNAAASAQHLVSDLAGFASLAAATPEAAQPVALDDVVARLVQRTSAAFPGGVRFEVQPLPAVWGHAQQLDTLFGALADNAVKACAPGRPLVVRISCSGPHLKNELSPAPFYAVRFADNGTGFDPRYAADVFKLFHRLDGEEERTGQGLGLALAQRIMANHGGSIHADARPGEGATFFLQFPAAAIR